MKKDYEPVSGDMAELHEADFVERLWTDRWDGVAELAAAGRVRHSSEYRVIRSHLAALPPGSRILDGGCGTGEWTVFLSDLGHKVVGLDLSRKTIERLRRELPNYDFVCRDVRRTEFEDLAFDAYLSWGVFEHFETGLGDCIVEAFRILKPGGWLFVSVPHHNWRQIIFGSGGRPREVFASGKAQSLRFYQWRLTRAELALELEMRGFRVHSVTPIHKLSGVQRLMQWELGWSWNAEWPVWRKAVYRGVQVSLGAILPAGYVSHMILAVAQKRSDG